MPETPLRVSIEFSKAVEDQIHRIKQRMELTAPIDVIRAALSLYDYATEMVVHHEAKIGFVMPNGDIKTIELR